MNEQLRNPENLMKVGIGVFAVALLGGVVALIVGWLSGGMKRGRRHAEGPPAAGSISPERHQHIQASSGR